MIINCLLIQWPFAEVMGPGTEYHRERICRTYLTASRGRLAPIVDWRFFVSGPERNPNGARTDPERTPNGPRTDPERTPHGPRMDPVRPSNRSRTDPEQTPRGPRTDPERTPNRPRTDPERTPHGPRTDPARTPGGANLLRDSISLDPLR